MPRPQVRRRNRRSVGAMDSYNWPDTFVVNMSLVTGTVTELQVEFSMPMVTQPWSGSRAFWNFRYWDTSANTTVITPFVEIVVISPILQAWLLSSALSLGGPWQAEWPVEWDNLKPVNGGRVRGYAPFAGTPEETILFPSWP